MAAGPRNFTGFVSSRRINLSTGKSIKKEWTRISETHRDDAETQFEKMVINSLFTRKTSYLKRFVVPWLKTRKKDSNKFQKLFEQKNWLVRHVMEKHRLNRKAAIEKVHSDIALFSKRKDKVLETANNERVPGMGFGDSFAPAHHAIINATQVINVLNLLKTAIKKTEIK